MFPPINEQMDVIKRGVSEIIPEDIEIESVDEVQKLTDDHIHKTDIVVVAKEKEIMTV